MHALSQSLYDELTSTLESAGRGDLVARLDDALRAKETLTSKQAAELLGVSSANTVKNWLKGGHFPGAFQTPGGHWRFLRAEVLAVRDRMNELRDKNRRRDLSPPDVEGAEDGPPLL
ncbi:MAG: helix-turn-helix domain-containing protein [Deltaproteobacteria bacterium]|nr:helix-turn-helix domain-containing protein [Deltaproteobacteria bacterium]